MTLLATLKLVAMTKQPKSGLELKREKLLRNIEEQMQIATAAANGTTHTKTRKRIVTDLNNEDQEVEVQSKPKQWWFSGADGKIYLTMRYGVRVIELAKGKTAIEVGKMAALMPTLDMLKQAVLGKELDGVLELLGSAKRMKKVQ